MPRLMDLALEGRRAVIVGAGPGIGRLCAAGLAQGGADVVCMTRSTENAQAAAAEARSYGVKGIAVSGDGCERADVERLIATAVDELGGVDICIDIVGSAIWGPLIDLSDEAWDGNLDITLRHAFLLAQLGAQQMREQRSGGSMVFISSTSSLSAAPNHGAYGAAKAAINSLVKTLAYELGPSGVRVNALAAGAIETPASRRERSDEQRRALAQAVPLERLGRPEDIARAVVFLASDLSGYITGQTITVDGGVSVNPFFPRLEIPSNADKRDESIA